MRLIAKNLAALLGSQAATWLIALVMLIVVPRYLHATEYGELSAAGSFVGFFGLFAGLGSSQFITKEIARDSSRVGTYVFNALVMTAMQAAFLAVLAIGLAHIVYATTPQIVVLAAISCIAMAVGSLNNIVVAALQGQQRMGRTAAWSVIDRYTTSGLGLLTVAAGKGLIAFALAGSCGGIISLIANSMLLWRQVRSSMRIDRRLWMTLAHGGMPFLLWSIALTIYGSIDVVMLSRMTTEATVGSYALAYRLINLPGFLAPLIVTAFFPSLSAHGASASPQFSVLARRALRLIIFLSAPMAIGLVLVAGDVIRLLHYSADYSNAIPLMRILALHIPFVGLSMVLGATLIASDRQRQWVVVGFIAAIVNPLLNLLAIPITVRMYGDGAIGTSIITVLTELFMVVGALYLCPQDVIDRKMVGFLARCGVASLTMLPLIIINGSAWLPVKVVLGVAIYFGASLVLQTISIRELIRHRTEVGDMIRLRRASSPS